MSRPTTALLPACLLSVALTVLALSPVRADEGSGPERRAAPATGPDARAIAARALDVATGVIDGDRGTPGASPTIALRDLLLARPAMDAEQRRRANQLLARPTQGANDPQGDGYTVRSRRTCSTRICVHWVPRTADAPPSRAWVDRTMKVLRRTWSVEVGRLDYRRPLKDGDRGGNAKFDVYLKDVGDQGFYGYCAPEKSHPDNHWIKSGYCVLDDDFARSQFDARPVHSLTVTAAHEFFHAIQFAYDYGEDGWLMESSATWMEERVADPINDNRQYLRYGQVAQPAEALDLFRGQDGFDQYGNWAFLEYLSQRFGTAVVRRIWTNASGNWRNHSIKAVRRALPSRQTFPEVFRAYAAGNTVPGHTYTEGDSWPSAAIAASHTLRPRNRSVSGSHRIGHLASRNVLIRPGDRLDIDRWRLRVSVDGPSEVTSPTAYLIVHRSDGTLGRKPVRLGPDGSATVTLRFNSQRVDRASLTLANASTRYDCWERTWTYACQGDPLDQDKRFEYRLTVFRP